MKGISDTKPERYVKSQDGTQVNYNVVTTTTETASGGSRTSYEYDYVMVEGHFTKGKAISAILLDDYSMDDQIAILANNAAAGKPTTEFIAFQTRRGDIKLITNKINFTD